MSIDDLNIFYKDSFDEGYEQAIDDLLTKIKCDRTLLEKWQLEVIESKAKQLKGGVKNEH